MPEPTVPLSLRLSPAQFRALDDSARTAGLTRSDLVRRLIARIEDPPDLNPSDTHARAKAA